MHPDKFKQSLIDDEIKYQSTSDQLDAIDAKIQSAQEQVAELKADIEKTRADINGIWDKFDEKFGTRNGEYTEEQLRQKWREFRAKEEQRYKRPTGPLAKHFNKILPPLPHDMQKSEIDEEALQTMKSLPSYRLAAIATLIGVMSIVMTIAFVLPWLMISPLWLIFALTGNGDAIESNVYTVVVLCLVTLLLGTAFFNRRNTVKNNVIIAAHVEEQWLRTGAENWSTKQRITSCLAFGSCHVINIYVPFVSCIALSAAGGAFMAAYLAEYRRSGDIYRATLASTKLHAQYNYYLLTIVLIVLAVVVAASTMMLFL